MPRSRLPSSERRVPAGTWWNLLAIGVQKAPEPSWGHISAGNRGPQDSSGLGVTWLVGDLAAHNSKEHNVHRCHQNPPLQV